MNLLSGKCHGAPFRINNHWTRSENDLVPSGRRHYLSQMIQIYGPFARYVILRVAHAPGMPGTFSPLPRVNNPDMHHGTCVTREPWCMPGSLTNGFLWSRLRGKRSRHSRRMRNSQFYVSDKRSMPRYDATRPQWVNSVVSGKITSIMQLLYFINMYIYF